MQRKQNFEYDIDHKLWLVKIYYPHIANSGIPIKNEAFEPIPAMQMITKLHMHESKTV